MLLPKNIWSFYYMYVISTILNYENPNVVLISGWIFYRKKIVSGRIK